MKHNFKLKGFIIGLAVISLCACEKSLVKSDYDYPINSENLPAGVTTNDADIYMTKARFSGNIDNTGNLADFGFIYCEADTFTKYGSVKAAMLAGAIPADNVFSRKDSMELTTVSTIFQKNREYVYTTYAVNYNGMTCGNEQLFKTENITYAPLIKVNGKSTEEEWKTAKWYFINKAGEGENFTFATNVIHAKANGYESLAKAGPVRYKRDNFMVLPGQTMGIDMKIDYLIYPLGGEKSGLHHSYAIVIATDSITDANCNDNAIVAILDSMTFFTEGNQKTKPSDTELYVKRTISIPTSYERKKVWIGIHHYNSTDVAKSLFVEEFKLY